MTYFHLILISFIFNIASSASTCPSKCICENNKIDCFHNEFSSLPLMDDFPKNIVQLIFSQNYLTTINSTFKFPLLKTLDLSKNFINFIQSNAFAELPMLEFLDLSRNKLANILSEHFFSLSKLKVLNLSENTFETFSENVFANNLLLEELVLSNNHLKVVDEYWFMSLPKLRTLSISNIKVYNLNHVTFRHNQQLENIDLSNNDFTNVPTNALRMLPKLKSLILDSNPIRMLNYQSFENLKNLEVLTLNRMSKLKIIGNFVFSDLHQLKRLEITYNPLLSYIDSESFLEMSANLTRFPIEVLLLHNNNLKTLSEHTLPWCKIPKVDLRDNKWVCDCNLRWIKECKDNQDFKSVKCHKPDLLSDIEIGVINISEFKCEKIESDHNKIIRIHMLLFGVMFMFFTGLFIAIYLQRHHFLKWCRERRRGPGSIYYVKVSKNLRNDFI